MNAVLSLINDTTRGKFESSIDIAINAIDIAC